jgi:DNA-binding NarL/FixJ family response regulator
MGLDSYVLIEDDDWQAQWLVRCLGKLPDLVLSGRAAHSQQARELMQGWLGVAPALVLLDVGLAGQCGLDLLPDIRRAWPQARVLVLSQREDEATVLRALRGGAQGYLLKDGDEATVLSAIESARRGLLLVSPAVARHLLTQGLGGKAQVVLSPGQESSEVSQREEDVLQCLAQGLTCDETARQLGVSPSTVHTYVRRLYAKLGSGMKPTQPSQPPPLSPRMNPVCADPLAAVVVRRRWFGLFGAGA